MKLFEVRNVNEALPVLLSAVRREGVLRQSRNGPAWVFKEPVTICYRKPLERVMFWQERDANPFFHLMESLWMLQGENNVEFLKFFVSDIDKYSDDGETFHGAYGYRWRRQFRKDQIQEVIDELRVDPTNRRQVIQMWDAELDLGRDGKDLPCNLTITFQINFDGQLDMMVFNRSNDIIWGALGANAVHFSFLQEYIAASVGVPVGRYWQVSANMHAYQNEVLERCLPVIKAEPDPLRFLNSNPYHNLTSQPLFPTRAAPLQPTLYSEQRFFDAQLDTFMGSWKNVLLDSYPAFVPGFFYGVAVPMLAAYTVYKTTPTPERFNNTRAVLCNVVAQDWLRAASEWVTRREDRWKKAKWGTDVKERQER